MIKKVFGLVKNTLGKGVKGVKVTAGEAFAYSDESGKWQLELDGMAKTGEFEFWHRDYFPLRITGSVEGNFSTFDFGQVDMRPLPIGGGKGSVVISDVVLDQFGRPVKHLECEIERIEGDQRYIVAQLFTNSQGGFEVALEPGRYDCLVYKFGYNGNVPKVFSLLVDEDRGVIK